MMPRRGALRRRHFLLLFFVFFQIHIRLDDDHMFMRTESGWGTIKKYGWSRGVHGMCPVRIVL